MKRDRLIQCRRQIAKMASIVETAISALVLIAIVVAGLQIAVQIFGLALAPDVTDAFDTLLRNAFNVVIGVEFVKMLAKHSPGSAIEVLLFAIARQMVVEHTSPAENLLSIIAILLIFVIRKYLFVPAFGSHLPGEDSFSASSLSKEESEEDDED